MNKTIEYKCCGAELFAQTNDTTIRELVKKRPKNFPYVKCRLQIS